MNLTRHVRDKKQLVLVLNGTPSFDPTATESSFQGFFRWDLGDGTLFPDSNTITHAYADTNQYTVRADKRYMSQVVALQVNSDDLISIDARGMTRLGATGGIFLAHTNPNLTTLILPIQEPGLGANLSQFRVDGCAINGVLDMTGITQMSGIFWANNNANITSVDASQLLTGGGSMTSIQLYAMPSCTSIDISGLFTLRSLIQIRNNATMTSLIMPNNTGISTGAFATMNLYQNSQLPSLDLSNTENINGQVRVYQSPNLQTILWPASPTGSLSELRIEQNDLQGAVDVSQFNISGPIRFHSNSDMTSFMCPSSSGGQSVNILWGYSCDITGTLDLTPIEVLRSSVILRNNNNMTQVNFNPTPHSSPLTFMDINSCDLTGTLDLSMFQDLGGQLRLYNNSNLSSITNPTSSRTFTEYWAYSCGLTGTLDLTGLTGLGGQFEVFSNAALTQITNPTSTVNFTEYLFYNCDITGTLDLTGLTGGFRILQGYNNTNLTSITFAPVITQPNDMILTRLNNCDLTGTIDFSPVTKLGGLFWLADNPNLTGITFPTSTVSLDDVRIADCDLTGTIDISTMNLEGDFDIKNNTNLTQINNPTNSNTFSSYDCGGCTSLGFVDMTPLSGLFDSTNCSSSFFNCGMTSAEVNELLVDYDTNSSGGISGRTLDLTGGNSAPDGTSGGFDGLTAKANLITKGYTVNTN